MLILIFILDRKKSKEALDALVTTHGFSPEQTLNISVQDAISRIFSKYYRINFIDEFSNIYSKQTSKGKMVIFDACYGARYRTRSRRR